MSTIQDFIALNGLTATVTPSDRNPNMEEDPKHPMDHWRVVVKMHDADRPARMTVYFSKGSGHHGKPAELAEVLDCLAMDAAGVENAQSFEDWCSEYGYDTNSRKAHRTYTVCKREAERLRKLLGVNAYDDLLWNTDRL